MNPRKLQTTLLTAIAFAAVAPMLVKTGTNVVTDTYARAAELAWAGSSPYAPPTTRGDWYKYSPLFALLYGALLSWGAVPQALAWALVNTLVFWWGVSRWFLFGKSTAPLVWACLALCAIELDISLRYQQVNAGITGLMLLGLAAYRDGRTRDAGLILALATNIKILPGFPSALLLAGGRRKYASALFAASLACLLAPAVLGWSWNLNALVRWKELLLTDLGAPGILDLSTALKKMGLATNTAWLRWTILLRTAALLLRGLSRISWGLWYTLAASALLLFSPRTESPTFVLFAPAYLFLATEVAKLTGWRKSAAMAATLAGGFFLTFAYCDLWPKAVWNPAAWQQTTKTFAVLGLWATSVWLARRQM